jgi:RNA polymerase sigma-70 factor (ECF subfamily)
MSTHGSFSTTQWSLILAAADSQRPDSGRALATLCESYWYPIYVHLRQLRHDPDTARDLTQGFFAHVLEKQIIKVADPERGRFRAFLKSSLRLYLANERHRARAKKRGGGKEPIAVDFADAEAHYRLEPIERYTPETMFERQWARSILRHALERLRKEAQGTSLADRLRYFEPYLTDSPSPLRYREVAKQLGMTESAVKVAINRVSRRYGEAIRAEVARTVHGRDEIDDEIRHLLAASRS